MSSLTRRTGRLVTSAALILFLSFTAMAASPGTDAGRAVGASPS